MVATEQLQRLITNPLEALETEYKPWLDTEIPEGKAVLVKACLALRNYGGGWLVIGFRDQAGLHRRPAPQYNVREKFSSDNVSRLVGQYSLTPFPTTVHFVTHEDVDYPAIEVAAGIRTPVATKRGIESPDGVVLLAKDAIYVRTLDSNYTPSTAIASKEDWEHIMRTCLESRETDVARFFRRHLTPWHVAEIRNFFGAPVSGQDEAAEEVFGAAPWSVSVLNAGAQRFATASAGLELPKHGAFEVGLALSIPNDKFEDGATRKFLNLLSGTNPNYWNGWPFWLNARTTNQPEVQPKPIEGQWQASLILLDPKKWTDPSIDFWTASPVGQFYHRRAFWEDQLGPAGVLRYPGEPLTILDAVLQIVFVAEALVVGQAFARAMGCDETAKLDFAFRWTRLSGRYLVSMLRPSRLFLDQPRATDDTATAGCFLPLDTAPTAIYQYVHETTRVLFNKFDGVDAPPKWVQQKVDEFIQRTNY